MKETLGGASPADGGTHRESDGSGQERVVWRQRKMVVLALLGFSSGLPLFLTSRVLQGWMTVAGVDLSTIGLFSLVALPYSLKFLWAPVMDRYVPPFLGRRRGWLLITQLCVMIAIAGMAI